jgi:hypothetical protein
MWTRISRVRGCWEKARAQLLRQERRAAHGSVPSTLPLAAVAISWSRVYLAAAAATVATIGIDMAHASATSKSTSSAASPASRGSSSPHRDNRFEDSEDEECPWCQFMAEGPCAEPFIAWRNCSKSILLEEKEKEKASPSARKQAPSTAADGSKPRHLTECMPLFKELDKCIRTPGPNFQYYRDLLVSAKRRQDNPNLTDEEEEEMEEEEEEMAKKR